MPIAQLTLLDSAACGSELLARCFRSSSCAAAPGPPQYDVVIRHGTVYDGTGTRGVVQDVAVQGDRIAARGDLTRAIGRQELDATGLANRAGRRRLKHPCR